MRRHIYIFLSVLLISAWGLCLSSCEQDRWVDASFSEDKGVSMSIAPATRAAEDEGDPKDYKISELRVMIFDYTTGDLAYNYLFEFQEDDKEKSHLITFKVDPNHYNFVFVANESSDNALQLNLKDFGRAQSAYQKFNDLDQLSFASTAFSTSKNIPMTDLVKDVEVVGNYNFKIGGVQQTGNWEIGMVKLGVRLDLQFKTTLTDKMTNFSQLVIKNVPKSVPLFENKPSDGTPIMNGGNDGILTDLTVPRADGDDSDWVNVSGTYYWKKSRIILPSSMFTDTDDAAQGVDVRAEYTGLRTEGAVLGFHTPKTVGYTSGDAVNYTLPRRLFINFKGEIVETGFDANIEISDWKDGGKTDWKLGERILRVSRTEVNITRLNGARIYFWSNMPVVEVGSVVLEGTNAENTWARSTNNTFVSLNTNRTRMTYDPTTGQGYMDILLQDYSADVNDQKRTLWIDLTAKKSTGETVPGLTKRIKINTDAQGAVPYASTTGANAYIGTFHRKNEVGERIISSHFYGGTIRWRATVVAGQDFIRLSTQPSADPNIGTDNPGDAEDYPVISDLTAVSGRGRIYFRVGMASTTTTNRYGKIEVQYLDGGLAGYTFPIYVRQGEDPDYVLGGPGDTTPFDVLNYASLVDYSAGIYTHESNSARPDAVKFSPYNLTANFSPTDNYVDLPAVKQGVFVDYPTKAGAHFQGKNSVYPLRAYRSNLATYSSSFINITSNNNPQASNNMTDWELCPDGYVIGPNRYNFRRPTDGSTTAWSANESLARILADKSEVRQSLFRVATTRDYPIPKNTITTVNHAFGFYADGFFDRRPIRSVEGTPKPTGTLTDVCVAPNTPDMAYKGAVFYNPTSYKSLFFPGVGRREISNTAAWLMVISGFYWTSSYADTGNQGQYAEGWVLASCVGTSVSGNVNVDGTNRKGTYSHTLGLNGFASIRCVTTD